MFDTMIDMKIREDSEFDVQQSIKNQQEVWKTLPEFAPSNGICCKCHQQIYAPRKYFGRDGTTEYKSGIDIEQSKHLVTGCPHCNRSYCD